MIPNEGLVWHTCPQHGRVLMALPTALVEHGRPKGQSAICGALCAPEGTTVAEHRKRYFARARQERHRASRKA